jgi:hypothetical protein
MRIEEQPCILGERYSTLQVVHGRNGKLDQIVGCTLNLNRFANQRAAYGYVRPCHMHCPYIYP